MILINNEKINKLANILINQNKKWGKIDPNDRKDSFLKGMYYYTCVPTIILTFIRCCKDVG